MTFEPIQTEPDKDNSSIPLLEGGLLDSSIEDRLLAAAQRILDRESGSRTRAGSLRHHQIPALLNFSDYLMDLATSPKDVGISPFCRIVLPPRTGKTVIGAKIIGWTGLCSTFVVPTKALVLQTLEELRSRIPDVQIGLYYGATKQPVSNGVNITTYATLQGHFHSGSLPESISRSALVFLDEAHHAMTFKRMETLQKAFPDRSIRVAITATPDYNESRQLQQFFPELIHELELIDALELGLLAPARMWLIEVDADASTVRFIAGDYEQETLGRLMSSSPFFKAVEIFRYAKANARVPALITCASRQQTYDLWMYLKKHKPKDSPAPGLVLGDTPNKEREQLLSGFENGSLNTLIQVGVLIEGWNSPRCKLLLDLAPSLSRVRATQKYFRVMTRCEDQEARIVVILPNHLPRQPVLPIDLILQPGENYACGDLIASSPDVAAHTVMSIDMPKRSPIRSVRIKTRVIASASLAKPRLEPDNLGQIRRVLASCPEFGLRLVGGSIRFRRLFFNHDLFVGSGGLLLRYLGIANGQKGYLDFMARLFPEELGTDILNRNGGLKHEKWGTCAEDLEYLIQTVLTPNDNSKGRPQEPFMSTLNALCGGLRQVASPEEILLMQEQIEKIYEYIGELNPREEQILIWRLGLHGTSEMTLQELADRFCLSRDRIRQIFYKAIRKLAHRYLFRTADRQPIVRAVFEFPDLSCDLLR